VVNWPWRKKAAEARYVDAVELLRWLDAEIEETIDSDQRMGLRQAREHVGKMEWVR
jgi:hypothetical protein